MKTITLSGYADNMSAIRNMPAIRTHYARNTHALSRKYGSITHILRTQYSVCITHALRLHNACYTRVIRTRMYQVHIRFDLKWTHDVRKICGR